MYIIIFIVKHQDKQNYGNILLYYINIIIKYKNIIKKYPELKLKKKDHIYQM